MQGVREQEDSATHSPSHSFLQISCMNVEGVFSYHSDHVKLL
jgi:hypothetical protein